VPWLQFGAAAWCSSSGLAENAAGQAHFRNQSRWMVTFSAGPNYPTNVVYDKCFLRSSLQTEKMFYVEHFSNYRST